MQQITIRDIDAKDIPDIHCVIRTIWDWDDVSDDQAVVDATVGMYLNDVLYDSTFGKIALLGDQVVGVIFGSVEGQPAIFRGVQTNSMEHMMVLLGASDDDRHNIYDYLSKLRGAYEQLICGREDGYDGTLDFLVLSEDARGMGIGKKLWHELTKYFKAHKVQTIYVYTDTDCNFGFYEHLGFARIGEKMVAFEEYGESYTENIFLYDYRFEQE